jgi:hypothetical protein
VAWCRWRPAFGASQEEAAAAAAGDDAVPEPALAKAGDGSQHEWLAGQPELDLIPGSSPGTTLDDATSEIYSAFLVEEEGTASSSAHSGDCDRPFQPKVITGIRDHLRPEHAASQDLVR